MAGGQELTSHNSAIPGWQAHLRLGFRPGEDRTILADRQRVGPLTVQRPFYPEGETCHVYLLHPPGGVVGGDRITLELEVAADAQALVTTPGASKYYRSAGARAMVNNQFRVAGQLEWLPQETIVFDAARLDQATVVDLAHGAKFAGWEIICLGRPASKQWFETGSLHFSLRLYREKKPLLIERMPVAGSDALHGSACLRSHCVAATMVVTPASTDCRQAVIQYLDVLDTQTLISATLLDDVLVIRYLGNHVNLCRQHFTAIWQRLRPSVFDRAAEIPRIWHT